MQRNSAMTSHIKQLETNPFAVKTPESLSAEDIVELFVPYPEFENLHDSGHQFLHGHRGSGKSMMLRMLSPDSQCIVNKCSISELAYFGVYVPIKATELNSPEYERLELETSGFVLSEHVLTTKLLSSLMLSVRSHCTEAIKLEDLKSWFIDHFLYRLKFSGWSNPSPEENSSIWDDRSSIINHTIKIIDEIQLKTSSYIKKRAFSGNSIPYDGPLLGFQDILLPTAEALKNSEIIPKKPLYFLLDDADNLSQQQTKVLNTWVSYRNTDSISLKISTQLNYKTYETTSGSKILSPHDFSHINFTSVKTGSIKERYPEIVSEIVRKRLEKYGLKNSDPNIFFPKDLIQEEKIKMIEREYQEKWNQGESGSYRAGDDSYRYSRPEYIRRLSSSKNKYKYAGFMTQVHISSGIIRFFLEPAARMFTEQMIKNKPGTLVDSISVTVQDQELRKQADRLLLQDFDDLSASSDESNSENIKKLNNLIQGIGALFRKHIMDKDATQRRVFSFSVSGEESQEVKEILHLGVINGYLYKDSIGDKTGMTRNTLYVLTRRLAPAFSLDPEGFSGYLTIKNELLLSMSENPKSYINRIRNKSALDSLEVSPQLSFLE